MILTGKKIILISPERWGVSMLSKHHYAIALAKRGNQVYFINPPSAQQKKVEVKSTDFEGLTIVDYSQTVRGLNSILPILPWLFSLLSRMDIRKIEKKLSIKADIVWSFDPFRFQHLKLFKASVAVFHPVDFFKNNIDVVAAQHADIIFSVAKPILERYKTLTTPAFFINHGLSQLYLDQSDGKEKSDSVIRCGYVGNLLSFAIHWENLTKIISNNGNVEFHFIGPISNSNLGSTPTATDRVAEIRKHPNVVFHGELSPSEVARTIQAFDLFLICYDPERVGSVVSNSHKVLEYLSTGKVVVSSKMSSYEDLASGLIEMVEASEYLPERFKSVVENISTYNGKESREKRVAFARKNSYENHIRTIEKLITGIEKDR